MILSGNLKRRKIYSRNKIIKPSVVSRFVINIYKIYLISRQIIIKIVLYFLSLNIYNSDNLVMKSIEISYYNRFKIENIISSL